MSFVACSDCFQETVTTNTINVLDSSKLKFISSVTGSYGDSESITASALIESVGILSSAKFSRSSEYEYNSSVTAGQILKTASLKSSVPATSAPGSRSSLKCHDSASSKYSDFRSLSTERIFISATNYLSLNVEASGDAARSIQVVTPLVLAGLILNLVI